MAQDRSGPRLRPGLLTGAALCLSALAALLWQTARIVPGRLPV